MLTIILWLVPALLLFAGLYLYLIRPARPHPGLAPFRGRAFAHRGLWNGDLPENSLPAFQRAADLGFGVELDVHLTRDGCLAVFHDDTLDRMCPSAPRGLAVSQCTLAELQSFPLLNTGCRIPEFCEALRVLDGRCPLIIELKTGPQNDLLARRTADAIRQHLTHSPYCIESFDPRILRYWRRALAHQPQCDVPLGQLAYGAHGLPAGAPRPLFLPMMRTMLCNAVSRPHFIAWGQQTSSFGVWLVRRLYHPFMAAWTVRSPQRMAQLRTEYDAQIFEGFIPKH